MRHLSKLKSGVALGIVVGIGHLVWAMLIAFGAAKPVLDYILKLHFLEFTYMLAPFDAVTAMTLVAVTAGVGFVIGVTFAAVWNWLVTPRASAQDDRGARAFAD
ncbi:MAG: hypothetical protein BGN95_08370 [Sphingomonas sp. 66-10]|uniref:hypothetical protein n=1 Tax=Sphingomonas sp. 66-10 TaxID=1895848 RepID=UPI000929A86B|nr:hypothetical protein [Sphingomonas sp. 66-10]OJU20704.1 MAG: hypothetical protein BGN95_08370 [Sphingomonas sp. 66-10]